MPVSISGDGAITGLELEAFEDVDVGSGASDGDVLTYDASGDLWIPQGIVPIAGIGSNVVQSVKTDTFTTASTTFVDVTGFDVTITPTSSTSKVLIIANYNVGQSTASPETLTRLMRDSTAISDPALQYDFFGTNRNRNRPYHTQVVLDSPGTTSAVTYKLQIRATANTAYFNRSETYNVPTSTTITAIEVAA